MTKNPTVLSSYVCLLLLILIPSFSLAQSSGTGALSGTVTDPTGAVVPNASVTATSADTGQARTTTTAADGTYRFNLLPPGEYKVKFEASGFKNVEVPGVRVTVTETAVLDYHLEVGAQTQEVTVQANVEAVQTATSTLGTVVTSQTVTDLPLNTRNYTNLIALSSGANASVNNATALGKGYQNIAVNGASTAQNNFQMDGTSVVNYTGNGTVQELGTYGGLGIPDPDTIQEFKIQTSTYDASYGRNAGANVNVVTKAGSNDFHGTAFEFFRNTVLNANDFFVKYSELTTGLPFKTNTSPQLDQNQYGGTLGGPVKKDKLFFFVSYQGTWQKNGFANSAGLSSGVILPPIPAGNRGTCPSGATSISQCDAATQGFVQALGANVCVTNPSNKTLFNIANTAAGASVANPLGAQVTCNGSNINPVAVQILQLKLPSGVPNAGNYYIPSSGLTPGGAGNNFGFETTALSYPAYYRERQGMGNWDYLINSKNTLSGRLYYGSDPNTSYLADGLTTGPFVQGNLVGSQYGNTDATLKLTSIISNNLVNEARISYQRNYVNQFNQNNYNAASLGMAAINPSADPQLPLLEITGMMYFGTHNFSVSDENVNQYFVADQISWTHGKHSIRTGFEFEHELWFWNYPSFQIGGMTFNQWADFLLGMSGAQNGTADSNVFSIITGSDRFQNATLTHYYFSHGVSAFVQDDFKVNSRLTLNLGLRWEFSPLVSDQRGMASGVWTNLINTQPNPGSGCVYNGFAFGLGAGGSGCSFAGFVAPSNYSTSVSGPLPAGVFLNNQSVPISNPVPWDNFAPRLGFAWQPLSTNRLVLRGGAGYFYDRVAGGVVIPGLEQDPPYVFGLVQSAAANTAATLATPFSNAPAGWTPRWVNFANGTSSNLNFGGGSSGPLNQTFITPVTYQYNLNVQYEFLPTWVVELGYVGSHGIHQVFSRELNPGYLASPAAPINGVTANTTSGATGPFVRVPYLGFAPTFPLDTSTGSFKYNSLQATVRKQFSHGLQFQAAYTWSRAFVLTQDGNPNASVTDNVPILDLYGLNPNYHPQRLVINYNWNLPLGHAEGLKGKLIEGWTVSGVTTIQDGTPITIVDGTLGSIFGTPLTSNAQFCAGSGNANVGTSGSLYQRVVAGLMNPTGGGYINKSAFAGQAGCSSPKPAIGNGTGFGNSGLDILLGPGQNNWDMSLSKITRVGGLREDATLQFRAEFFNTFNHPQFSNPGTASGATSATTIALTQGNAGEIIGSSVNPRLIQFALKYVF